MATACILQVTFGFESKEKPIVATFDMPHASSDGGAVLLSGNTKALIGSGPQWAWRSCFSSYRGSDTCGVAALNVGSRLWDCSA